MNSPQLLNALVKGAREYALLLVDPDEKITYWNQGAEKVFGYTEGEILGRSVYQLFTAEDVELKVAFKELEKAREDGWAEDERWHVRKDGTRFWATGVVTTVHDEAGELIGYSKVLRDVTLRKQTEDKLKSAVSELTQFSYAVSHDLQEPLRLVEGYLKLIERNYAGKVDPQHDEFVSVAKGGVSRLQALLTDLLSYVRADRPGSMVGRTDTAAIVDMAISNLTLTIADARAVVTRSTLPPVNGVSTQLVQLFQNLIGNAIKFRRPGEMPKVFVDAQPEGALCRFSVCDNGVGVPNESQATVFEPFERGKAGDGMPGTGLGLFLCKKIVERHGGKIWMESSPGVGTKVFFTLPIAGRV